MPRTRSSPISAYHTCYLVIACPPCGCLTLSLLAPCAAHPPSPQPTISSSSSSNGSSQEQPPAPIDDPLLASLSSELSGGEEEEGAEGASGSSKTWLASLSVLGGIGLLIGGGYVFREPIKLFLDFFINAVDEWGPWGYLAYAAVYTGLEVLAVPAIPLTMTAGVIFGPIPGTIITSISATIAATIAFLIARYAARDKVGRWAGRRVEGGLIGEGGREVEGG